jgi:hypothetical protein
MGGMILVVKLYDNDERRGDKIPWGTELRELLIIEVEWQGALSAIGWTEGFCTCVSILLRQKIRILTYTLENRRNDFIDDEKG